MVDSQAHTSEAFRIFDNVRIREIGAPSLAIQKLLLKRDHVVTAIAKDEVRDVLLEAYSCLQFHQRVKEAAVADGRYHLLRGIYQACPNGPSINRV
jgi:hypothetical protein